MNQIRNHFLLALILMTFINCKPIENIDFHSRNFELIKLDHGLYACIHKFGGKAISNAGIIDNGNETIIFDSFLDPSVTEEIKEIVQKAHLSPIKYVINSHSHNDHIRGNQVFDEGVKIVSTKTSGDLIEKWEPLDIKEEKEYAPQRFAYYDSLYQNFEGDTSSREYLKIMMWRPYYEILSESYDKIQTRLPDLFVENEMEFNGPLRRVKLITKGSGHTDSDLILHLPDDQVIFTGDLVFNNCHPYLAHGQPSAWKRYLDFLVTLESIKVIPGHGEISDEGIILQMKEYIENLETIANELITKGEQITEGSQITIPDKYKSWWFERFYPINLKFLISSIQDPSE